MSSDESSVQSPSSLRLRRRTSTASLVEAPKPSSQVPLKVLEGHTGTVKIVAFFPNPRRLVSSSYGDATLFIWDIEAGEIEKKISGHGKRVNSVAVAPDGSIFASGGKDGTLRFWHGLTGEQVEEPIVTGFVGDEVWGVSFSRDGRRVAATGGHSVQIWDPRTREPVAGPFAAPAGGLYTTAFSPDSSRIAADAAGGAIRVWDPVSGEVVFELSKGHSDTVRWAAFTPDGQQLVTFSEDGTVCRWDMDSGERLGKPLEGHTGEGWTAALSPNGNIVACPGTSNTIRLWDAKSGSPKSTFLQLDTQVKATAFSPDGSLLAAGCYDNKIYIWDMKAIEAGWCTSPLSSVRNLTFLLQSSKMMTIRSWMWVFPPFARQVIIFIFS
ncbi:hypothetical protein HYDPIDRAFT_84161 [Hydnomerulius pinastri MD-312]|nr:hypothetical protein HYDPIDRAFT_84161 [Hydnomerulius pinastri MD-312]